MARWKAARRSGRNAANLAKLRATAVRIEKFRRIEFTSATGRAPFGAPSVSVQSDARYFRSVARVGVQVAEALEYAHQQGDAEELLQQGRVDGGGELGIADVTKTCLQHPRTSESQVGCVTDSV